MHRLSECFVDMFSRVVVSLAATEEKCGAHHYDHRFDSFFAQNFSAFCLKIYK